MGVRMVVLGECFSEASRCSAVRGKGLGTPLTSATWAPSTLFRFCWAGNTCRSDFLASS